MARPARFTDDDILDGAARALARSGPAVTIAQIARTIDGPSGSIYHRFASREELLARLWLRAVGRFHEGLLEAYALPGTDAAIAAASRHVVAFCRTHPLDAGAMLLFRQSALVTTGPASVREEALHVNDAIDGGAEDLIVRRFGRSSPRRRQIFQVGTRLGPYGLVRPFIGGDIPDWLEDAAAASALAVMPLGDTAHQD
ncbi:TetR/AcrR family transcriptional regulator [Brachybacterium hainanense]|uniref:TetR/AcrR family transcriptional regulator n=1 Tax=Brachybacterium hainanense TaxID=1541174 RepID=A0ABV6RGI7_9MICO